MESALCCTYRDGTLVLRVAMVYELSVARTRLAPRGSLLGELFAGGVIGNGRIIQEDARGNREWPKE
jgi:hypothetical protein